MESTTSLTVESEESDVFWDQPPEWAGPVPILYQSFDTSQNIILMEGTQQRNLITLIAGKVIISRLYIFAFCLLEYSL